MIKIQLGDAVLGRGTGGGLYAGHVEMIDVGADVITVMWDTPEKQNIHKQVFSLMEIAPYIARDELLLFSAPKFAAMPDERAYLDSVS